ncbi:MAG: aminotransferase class I/II-fold pyridoxal phosphate-dependent enzyme [Alphaproteobacteria bacterium]
MTKLLSASKRSDIPMFRALDILSKVNELDAAGGDIRRLGAGQPCFGAPQQALDYATKIIQDDPKQGYTEAIGMPSLRARISKYYEEYYKADLAPEQIVITNGSSCGFILAFICAFDAGDKVALITPTYPAYRNFLKALSIEVIEIEGKAGNGYQPTVELLEKSGERFDGLIINSPSNPSGTLIDEGELIRLCQWCDKKGVRLISDEAYHGITYEEKAGTALKYSRNAIILNTFSKYFAMTGWRLGWITMPDNLTNRAKKISENFFVAPPTLSQHVAYKVFDHLDTLNGYVSIYNRNREILCNELPSAGITSFTEAQGAFYVYADISEISDNSIDFCARMLNEARVSTTPGIDFDLTRGHQGIRICYADSTENIIEACQRLKDWNI